MLDKTFIKSPIGKFALKAVGLFILWYGFYELWLLPNGRLDHWVALVKPGRILFEIDGVSKEEAVQAFRDAGHKLPIKTKLVERRTF